MRSERFKERIRTLVLPGFEGIPIYDVLIKLRDELRNDTLSIRASSISFFFILALFPGIIFLFSLIPYVPIKHFDKLVLNFLNEILPNGVFPILESTIKDIVSIQRGGLTSINFFLAIFVASGGVTSMMRAFDKMNHTFKKRNFWQKRIASIRILVLVNTQLIIAVLFILKGKEVIQLMLTWLNAKDTIIEHVLKISKTIIIILSFFNTYALVYYFGPSVIKKYRYFSAGATFATAVSILMSYLFRIYTSYLNNFNRLYGSLGIMIVIMMWIYLNAFVLLFGFEINHSIALNKALREDKSTEGLNDEV